MYKNIKLFASLVVCFAITTLMCDARGLSNDFDKAYKEAGMSKQSTAVSIQDLKRYKRHFEYNEDKPVMPASTQKVATIIPSMQVLGDDYKFKTKLYKVNNKNEYYLVLGADPYLRTSDLKHLLRCINLPKEKPIEKLYIDDSIFDRTEWGEGWQWDDDLNPLMPKFSAYNLDKNLLTLSITRRDNQAPEIEPLLFYPVAIMNFVKNGSVNSLKISRKNYISPDVITFDGEITGNQDIQIPINNMKLYFELRIKDKLRDNKLSYYGKFENKKLPKTGVTLIGEVSHPIDMAKTDIFINSNNLVAETVFKLAGAKYTSSQGSLANSLKMFNDFCMTKGIDASDIKIVDGSGVSKNNIVTARFMTEFLTKVAQIDGYEKVSGYLATPNPEIGTLKARMLYFGDNLHAKTGTLSDVSALVGFLKTKKGKIYAFSIFSNDSKTSKREKKTFEEYILREVYRSL